VTHAEVSHILIGLFVQHRKGWRIIPNRSGVATFESSRVPYGVPPTGGGSDYMAFGPGAQCEFWEVKTLAYPRMSKRQKRWATIMTDLGFSWYIFRETAVEPWYEITEWKNGGEKVCSIPW
jgi:hypothetical protein